jgi:hypothetical protein
MKNLGIIRWDLMAFCDRQLSYYYYHYFVCCCCCFFFFTPLNCGVGAIFFWLFVTKMMIQGEDDVLPSSFCWQTLRAQSQVVNQKLLNGFVDIAVPYFDNGGRRMVMFDNRLYLVGIV